MKNFLYVKDAIDCLAYITINILSSQIVFRMEALGYAGPLIQVFDNLFPQHSNMK